MCGIIAVVRRRTARTIPDRAEILGDLSPVATSLRRVDLLALDGELERVAQALEAANARLSGVAGVEALLQSPDLRAAIAHHTAQISSAVADIDARLDAGEDIALDRLERINAALARVKDARWAIAKDRLRTAEAVGDLLDGSTSRAAVEAFTSVQIALSAIDRLEVRGRDSAGLHLLVRGHQLDLESTGISAMLERAADPLFRSGTVRAADGMLGFVYKAAAEIGELGDNTRALREAITADELLHLALAADTAEMTVLGHTRWASVGIISEANAHPLDSHEQGSQDPPYVIGALNGDVDNFADLKSAEGLRIAAEITTDAKVIPTLVSRKLRAGVDLRESFRGSVAGFEGSVAIAANSSSAPDRLLLALRGSGQALYVGLADDTYIVASEPYGLVEETSRYLRMDGETPSNADNPTASRGQLIGLDGARAGTIEGIERLGYDGTELPVTERDIVVAQITTRDIDRGNYRHFLLKEITESPASFRKTLRGKLVERDGQLELALGDETLPSSIREDLRAGRINRVIAIGQGTAHVAGQSFVAALRGMAPDHLRVDASLATELSGFGLRPDMADTLIVAISQSGTTTDTNRTVDLVRARGARVIAVVNRRNSDLTDKSDGVLYTSDGRDVEMSVASTKALYSQIAAGFVLAAAIAETAGGTVQHDVLAALRALPDAMTTVVEHRAEIGAIAQQFAPSRRYWAVVGNGSNRIAASELRIKLSELCYKSIACDSTEDKKHIDLSSEPLILVCAAGLSGSNADDVAKEVAIFRAHKATPIVIASEGDERFSAAVEAIKVPATHPSLAFVLSCIAGHLFGYEAALAIDAQALPLREARAAIETEVSAQGSGFRADGDQLLRRVRPTLESAGASFFDGLRTGSYDGHLEASTAVRLSSLLRYGLGISPLDSYQVEHGKIGTPAVVVEDLTLALTRGIEELTRPVDAIKHQAKTVTVGISRSDETLLQVPLATAVMAAGAPRDSLSYKTLRTLADLDPAVEEVTGWIRYRIEGDPATDDEVFTSVIDRGGIAAEIPSRIERDPVLRGTKHTVAIERDLLVFRGRSDGRTLIAIPETKDNHCTGITQLHVRFEDRLPVPTCRAVLHGYRNRYAALRDAVTETEPSFREDLLGELAVVDLLTEPVHVLADSWRTP
ncbi:MAG TPA: SIS domain-containing protein [Acidimicrobiales bacterium]|jgi:glucosamine--fructose-6-phosphate aminotransferase (isomerizing)